MFQMQQAGGRSQQQGLTAQITAQTLGSISNRGGYQPNKVIIEQTEESSDSSVSSEQDSIDNKPLGDLFTEFITAQANQRTAAIRSASCNKSEQMRRQRLRSCKTPEGFQYKRGRSRDGMKHNRNTSGSGLKKMNSQTRQKSKVLFSTHRGSVEGEDSIFDHYQETESAISQLPIDDDTIMTTQISQTSSNMIHVKKAVQLLQQQVTGINPTCQMTLQASQKRNLLAQGSTTDTPQFFNDKKQNQSKTSRTVKVGSTFVDMLKDELPKTITVSQFLDDTSVINYMRPATSPATQTANNMSMGLRQLASPGRIQKKVGPAQKYRMPPRINTGLQASSSQKDQVIGSPYVKPTAIAPLQSSAMKEKMEYTVQEIGNFMDADSIKARTEIPYLKKQQYNPDSHEAKRVTVATKQEKKPKLRKAQQIHKQRKKIEGFFKNNLQSNFNSATSAASKREITRVKSTMVPLVVKNPLAVAFNSASSTPQSVLVPAHSAQLPQQQQQVEGMKLPKSGSGVAAEQKSPLTRSDRGSATQVKSSKLQRLNASNNQVEKNSAKQRRSPRGFGPYSKNMLSQVRQIRSPLHGQKVKNYGIISKKTHHNVRSYSGLDQAAVFTESQVMVTSEGSVANNMAISSNNHSFLEATTPLHEYQLPMMTAMTVNQSKLKLDQQRMSSISGYEAEADGTTSRAPVKQISILTKQLSAQGDQEADDMAFDEMIETVECLSNDQPALKESVKSSVSNLQNYFIDRGIEYYNNSPNEQLSASQPHSNRNQKQLSSKLGLRHGSKNVQLDLGSSIEDEELKSDPYFPSLECYSPQSESLRGKVKQYMHSAIYSNPNSNKVSPASKQGANFDLRMPKQPKSFKRLVQAASGATSYKDLSNSKLLRSLADSQITESIDTHQQRSTQELIVFDNAAILPHFPQRKKAHKINQNDDLSSNFFGRSQRSLERAGDGDESDSNKHFGLANLSSLQPSLDILETPAMELQPNDPLVSQLGNVIQAQSLYASRYEK